MDPLLQAILVALIPTIGGIIIAIIQARNLRKIKILELNGPSSSPKDSNEKINQAVQNATYTFRAKNIRYTLVLGLVSAIAVFSIINQNLTMNELEASQNDLVSNLNLDSLVDARVSQGSYIKLSDLNWAKVTGALASFEEQYDYLWVLPPQKDGFGGVYYPDKVNTTQLTLFWDDLNFWVVYPQKTNEVTYVVRRLPDGANIRMDQYPITLFRRLRNIPRD